MTDPASAFGSIGVDFRSPQESGAASFWTSRPSTAPGSGPWARFGVGSPTRSPALRRPSTRTSARAPTLRGIRRYDRSAPPSARLEDARRPTFRRCRIAAKSWSGCSRCSTTKQQMQPSATPADKPSVSSALLDIGRPSADPAASAMLRAITIDEGLMSKPSSRRRKIVQRPDAPAAWPASSTARRRPATARGSGPGRTGKAPCGVPTGSSSGRPPKIIIHYSF